jgi:hypothetical protein
MRSRISITIAPASYAQGFVKFDKSKPLVSRYVTVKKEYVVRSTGNPPKQQRHERIPNGQKHHTKLRPNKPSRII